MAAAVAAAVAAVAAAAGVASEPVLENPDVIFWSKNSRASHLTVN